jgi:hypothetical protein
VSKAFLFQASSTSPTARTLNIIDEAPRELQELRVVEVLQAFLSSCRIT